MRLEKPLGRGKGRNLLLTPSHGRWRDSSQKPITRKRMEQTREPTHGPQQEHEEVPHQEISEMPQGMHFPPNNYWE